MKIRRILISTSNNSKLVEFKKHFSNYGIDVVQINSFNVKDLEISKNISIKYTDNKFNVVSIINEESNLYKNNIIVSDLLDGDVLNNISELTVYDSKENTVNIFKANISGIIDIKKRNNNKEIFGWDDVFVSLSTGKSYHEMREMDLKVSARDQTISKYIKHRFHYKDRIDLNWNKSNSDEVINFDNSIISNNELLNFDILQHHNLDINLKQVINNGVFFRSAKNRIQKNYWLPGLNAGIPFVPKKDLVHETTFMFHDFMHFLMPDLIIGNSNNKQLYIIHRMMSEAFSLVYADMLYVDCLKNNNINYDYSKRKIYPIYSDSLKNNISLKELLLANAKYVIFGDDTNYKKFVSKDNLKEFKTKYSPFFVEDFKWTNKNWENIKYQNLDKWYKDFFSDNLLENTYTINQMENLLNIKDDNNEEIFEKVFNYYYEVFTNKEVKKENPLKNSFKRYLVGQAALFSKYSFNTKVKYYYAKTKSIINDISNNITIEDIKRYKSLIQTFINNMANDNLISIEDAFTYSEVYPIFKPFYVFYDEDKKYYKSLEEISNIVLK